MPARPLHRPGPIDFPPVEWFVGPVDVVHGTNFVVPPDAARRAVVTVHDLTPLRYPELCDGPSLAFPNSSAGPCGAARGYTRTGLRRRRGRRSLRRRVPSEVQAVAPGCAEVVAPGAATRNWRHRRGRLALPPGRRATSSPSGTAEPRKDLPGLVAAFDDAGGRSQDVALVLVGPEGWGTKRLEGGARRGPSRDRIVRTGWVSDAELGACLAGAAVLAYPSLYEGFGLPPLAGHGGRSAGRRPRAGAVPEALGDAAHWCRWATRGRWPTRSAQVLDSGADAGRH